ncbi:transposase [Microvirga sp. BT689]|uniref:IS701 family transposase n=1 Tax=Microvirga arvi TaxID=2778731 RepID=UPI0019526D06|nr:transposase [Microvirga arvi]MBM6580853.1 transposase [Microvirga arvi]
MQRHHRTGLSCERHFVNYHRVLSRARWSAREAARLLLDLLINTFVPAGPVILGLDDTIERRRGRRIKAKGIYRDPVRSSDAHFVKASGLRWISLMLLAPIPWAARTWALPFLTALAPSERYCHEHGKRHKKLTDWARQMMLQARRWLPERELILVADMGFAALELLAALSRRGVICITRLRLDAALYEPAPPRRPGTSGRPRTKGARLPNLSEVLKRTSTRWRRVTVSGWYGEGDRTIEFCSGTAVWRHGGMPIVPIRWVLLRDPLGRFSPQALLCTDPAQDPLQVIRWFILRWQIEVTFQEARAHLGVETQRQWSDPAVARTTPCLLGLFSIVTLLAGQLGQRARTAVLSDSWYRKSHPTFSDSLAAVRRHIWCETGLVMSRHRRKTSKPPRALHQCLINALCHAA